MSLLSCDVVLRWSMEIKKSCMLSVVCVVWSEVGWYRVKWEEDIVFLMVWKINEGGSGWLKGVDCLLLVSEMDMIDWVMDCLWWFKEVMFVFVIFLKIFKILLVLRNGSVGCYDLK